VLGLLAGNRECQRKCERVRIEGCAVRHPEIHGCSACVDLSTRSHELLGVTPLPEAVAESSKLATVGDVLPAVPGVVLVLAD
jgi:hypothetical protein